MHVGVFLGDFKPTIGGGFTFVNEVAEAFFEIAGESAHRFTVLCPPDAATALQARALPQNVRVVALAPRTIFGRAVMALRHLSPLFAVLWRLPSGLERVAKRERIELIWFVGGFFDTPDVPYIATVWDIQHRTHPWFPEVSAGGKWDYREAVVARHVRRAMRVITGSQIGKQELIAFYGVPESHIAQLPHPTPGFALKATPQDKQKILDRFGLRNPFLLYPAQFWAHKNHHTLLQALSHLRQSGRPLPDLALVGSDKGNQAYILKQAKALGLEAQVRCLGFVSTEELIGLYQSAAALVYTSFSGPENLPPLEAFALRCPVLNGEFPGAREQLGDAALYFDPHDPASIANAVGQMLSDPEKTKARVELGYARAQSWTGHHFVRGVLKTLDEVVEERRCWE